MDQRRQAFWSRAEEWSGSGTGEQRLTVDCPHKNHYNLFHDNRYLHHH
ncbi:MAG: hypothetical protein K5873_00735 [Treponema sp.]|nr:hypothetical protein [Treponema sp.]